MTDAVDTNLVALIAYAETGGMLTAPQTILLARELKRLGKALGELRARTRNESLALHAYCMKYDVGRYGDVMLDAVLADAARMKAAV